MTYKAATSIKMGSKEDSSYLDRGDTVKKGDFDDAEWDDLVAAKAVVTSEEYDKMFPEGSRALNQPFGTPSNLEQVEGTTLQVNTPEEGPVKPEDQVANPADPPKVEKADGDVAGTGSAAGFDVKGATNKTSSDKVKGVEGPPGDAGPDKK